MNNLRLISDKARFCEIKEHNGFLKYVCEGEEQNPVIKCAYSDTYYKYQWKKYKYHTDVDWMKPYSTLCQKDPHFYQMCDLKFAGERDWDVNNNELLCGSYLCDSGESRPLSSFYLAFLGGLCTNTCRNIDLDNRGCEDEGEEQVTLPSGMYKAAPSKICNDECDTLRCEDEANCNGYTYGMYCRSGSYPKYYVPPPWICDNSRDCDKGEDQANCEVTEDTETSCGNYDTGRLVPVHNYTRCTLYFYCKHEDANSYDLTNCSDPARVGLRCEINGYMSTVSKYFICYDDEVSVCDDKLDSQCFKTNSCKIHKHLMCDKKTDCTDGADETHSICRSMTKQTCKRRGGEESELPIPTSWIQDGVRDCENGIDETENFPTCGKGKTLRYFLNDYDKCENVYICKTGDPGYVELNKLCDGLDTCGNENEVCSVSSRSYSITSSVSTTNKRLTKTMSYCMKGMGSLEKLKGSCIDQQYLYPEGDIFGADTKTTLSLPSQTQSCDHMYGEQYLYTSCTGRCSDARALCPLKTLPGYEVCPNHYPDRIGTIVNNEYLIFVTKSFGNIYTNRYFVCEDKKKCIDYSQVCDLVHDCVDKSDEKYCKNNFTCDSSKHLLPKTKKCDGNIDCADLSDECNEECRGAILEGAYIEGLSWTIGTIAVAANLVIIGKSLWTLKRCRTAVAVMNRCLIIMIAFGDFLIGCYLTVIATYDTIIFKDGYCKKQLEWITSLECSVIGVLSTIGSQISLFSMTGLSLVRIHGIWNSMKISGEVTINRILKIITVLIFFISASVAIAVVPILSIFEDFFVNALKFSDELKIFVGKSDKKTILSIVKAYFGRAKNSELSWKTLIKSVREMFSHNDEVEDHTSKIDKVDFYGNDGVCLFKYFVQNEDPQRMFVWSILALNFVCFILIAFSYLLIGILSRRSSEGLAMSQNNQQVAQRNRRMNSRIAIIITTDFLCWIPFITTCILHSLEVVDATPWYSIFSMIILPINSVINPFLYDGAITNAITTSLRSMSAKISNSAIGNYLITLATTWRQSTTRVSSSAFLQAARVFNSVLLQAARLSNSVLLQAARVSNSVLLQAVREWFNPDPLPTEDIEDEQQDEQQETNV